MEYDTYGIRNHFHAIDIQAPSYIGLLTEVSNLLMYRIRIRADVIDS